tara:strand:+ start:1646 stop:1954 length:309 start_codon:yes stop_codon:yes gene_type:complete
VPINTKYHNDTKIYDIMIDVDRINPITVTVNHRHNNGNIILKKIEVNGVEISDINAISQFRTINGEIQKNNGYINAVGEFLIKIHTNVISHNYLNYLISLTK